MGVAGGYFVDDGLFVFNADVESLADVAGRWSGGGLRGNGDGGG